MNKHYQKSRKQAGLLGAICGSLLISLPEMPAARVALAMPRLEAGTSTTPLNPRPSILNEPPYNRSQPTSPPNDQGTPSTSPQSEPTPGSVIQPPLPEEQQDPSAIVTPRNGMVSIRLVNETGANITYQVIDNTDQRSLQGKSNVMLQDLPIPVTLTFKRQDAGLLSVTPASSEPGMLEVTFRETTDLGTDKSTMRIQEAGGVYLY